MWTCGDNFAAVACRCDCSASVQYEMELMGVLEFGLKRITTTVRGSGDWWLCVRVPVRVVFYFDLLLFCFVLFCFAF
jgi:hypothetical protein